MISLLCYAGVYAKTKGTSPWEVFSMIRAGNFKLGGYAIGIVLLTILMIGMCVQERFFCRFSVRWVQSFPCFRHCRS